MESHISFKWKSLEIISFQSNVGPFRIISEKNKAKDNMETEKQNNYYAINQLQANLHFYTP